MDESSEKIYENAVVICRQEANRTGRPRSGEYVKKSSCRAAVAFFSLLFLLLLAGLITLVFFFTQGISERDEQTLTIKLSHNNLTAEIDKLKTSYNNLANEQAELLKRLEDMDKENKAFQRYNQGWKYFRSSSYYVSTETKTWNASRNECLNKGADLVIVNTDEEQQFLIELNKSVWIGLTDEEDEGVWKWVDGTTLTKSYWPPPQPDNAGGENCAAVQNTGNKLLKWNDLPCSYKTYWVCEKNLRRNNIDY